MSSQEICVSTDLTMVVVFTCTLVLLTNTPDLFSTYNANSHDKHRLHYLTLAAEKKVKVSK